MAATVTGNTIEAAAELRALAITFADDDNLKVKPPGGVFTHARGTNGRARTVSWHPLGAELSGLSLQLQRFDLGITDLHHDFILDELSPIPVQDLLPEIRDLVAKRIGRTASQANLCIKHSLARTLFAATANRAIIRHICNDTLPRHMADSVPSELEIRLDSLASYIHPNSKAVHEAYAHATERLMRPQISGGNVLKTRSRDLQSTSHWVALNDMVKVVQWLASRAKQRDGLGILEHHRHYVLYVAAMLVASTGHRRALALFPFLFTLDLDEQFAFIADKIQVGSEARFVPLTQIVVQQLLEYRTHVMWLIENVKRFDANLANEIRAAVGLLRTTKGMKKVTQTGLLFVVRRGRPAPVSTAAVDQVLNEASKALGLPMDSTIHTRALRRNLATSLADDGASGMQIELMLGHNGDQHVFGAASCWVPMEQMDALRPLLSDYIKRQGWEVIRANWATRSIKDFKTAVPSVEQSNQAFEGRALDASEARIRARQAILEVLPTEVLLDDQDIELDDSDLSHLRDAIKQRSKSEANTLGPILAAFDEYVAKWKAGHSHTIPRSDLLPPIRLRADRLDASGHLTTTNETLAVRDIREEIHKAALRVLPKSKLRGGQAIALGDAEVTKIREQLERNLANDPAASAKVLTEFADLANSWRRSGRYRVTAASINLARFAPGPISIIFPRHLAIAKEIIRNLPSALEQYLGSREIPTVRRLAAILVLLIICDAVLKRNELEELMVELQNGGVLRYKTQLHIRAGVTSPAANYDRTVDFTFKTAAAVLGYIRNNPASKVIDFEAIEKAANQLLARVIRHYDDICVTTLLIVMRPYWFLRLPATVYASAVGIQECNAASEASSMLLLGAKAPTLAISAPERSSAKPKPEYSLESALSATRDLLRKAEGVLEASEGASRQQRKRLRSAFSQKLDQHLLDLMTRIQIVDLWVNFLYYLLEVGGLRVDKYHFGSLKTYQSRILPALYSTAWNVDVLDLDREKMIGLYGAVLERVDVAQRDAAKTPLKIFFRYLHQWWGAPYCTIDHSTKRSKRVARSVIVPARLMDSVVDIATRPNGERSPIGGAAASLLTVNHAFGLRTKEGYGLQHRDFLAENMDLLRVRRNTVRSVKTVERTIPVCLAGPSRQKVLLAGKAASHDPKTLGLAQIFVDPLTPEMLYNYGNLTSSASWAIKTATGDPEAVPYSLRHTFATSVMSHLLMPNPVASLIACKIAESLALPSTARTQIAGCEPGTAKYPLQVDRLALWMGQQGVETLSTTYWHGAWWVASEYCARDAVKNSWNSSAMGALIGVDSSAVRHRLPKRNDINGDDVDRGMASAVARFVEGSPVPEIGASQSIGTALDHKPPTVSLLPALSMLDALLMLRRSLGGEFGDLELSAQDSLYVNVTEASAFYKGYQDVGSETSFLDFEPDGNRAGVFSAMKLEGGHNRRRALQGLVMQKMQSSSEFARTTLTIVGEWQSAVDGARPFLISRRLEDLRRQVDWLQLLGYHVNDISIHCYRVPAELSLKVESLGFKLERASSSLARAARIGSPAEFGIEVRNSRILPNKREFQRVVFALACAAAGDLLSEIET